MKRKRIFICLTIVILFLCVNNLFKTINLNQGSDESNSLNLNNFQETNIFKPKCSCQNYKIILKREDSKYNVYKLSNYGFTHLYEISTSRLDSSVLTCDYFSSLKRGPNQKIISYSLFGKNLKYYEQLDKIIQQAKLYFPDWVIRIYYDSTINEDVICKYECQVNQHGREFIDFCNVKSLKIDISHLNFYYWRWLVIGDDFVDLFVSRDVDSWIIEREYLAVTDWLRSNTLFHVMRGIVILFVLDCLLQKVSKLFFRFLYAHVDYDSNRS